MNRFLIGVVVTIIIAWLLREGCNRHSLNLKDQQIALLTQKINTLPVVKFIQDSGKTQYIPQPYPVKGDSFPVYIDTSIKIECTDSAKLAYLLGIKNDYFKERYYPDTVSTPYGSIWINDSIKQNRISHRGINYDFSIPEKHYRDTIVQKVNLTRFFIGPTLMGWNQDPLRAGGLDFELITKKDKSYGGAILYDRVLKSPMFQVKLKFEIK